MAKATIKQLKEFFEADGGAKVGMQELKELKASRDGRDYDDIANGIGDGTLTY
jgi:hypothetical protein